MQLFGNRTHYSKGELDLLNGEFQFENIPENTMYGAECAPYIVCRYIFFSTSFSIIEQHLRES